MYIVIQNGKFFYIQAEQPIFFLQIFVLGVGFYGFRFIHFCGKIKFLFHALIVLIRF